MNIKYVKEIGDIKYPKVFFPKICLILMVLFLFALLYVFSRIELGDYVTSRNNIWSSMSLLQYIFDNIF